MISKLDHEHDASWFADAFQVDSVIYFSDKLDSITADKAVNSYILRSLYALYKEQKE